MLEKEQAMHTLSIALLTPIIALTLASRRGADVPGVFEWAQAKVLADKFEAAGHFTAESERIKELEEELADVQMTLRLEREEG